MIPIETLLTDFTFHLPGAPGQGEMPCLRRSGYTYTFWRPEPGDDVAGAHAVSVLYQWPDPIPIGLGFAAIDTPFERLDFGDGIPARAHGGVGMTGLLDEGSREWLASGGLFALRVAMVPPPPVAVWLAMKEGTDGAE